MYKVKQEEDIVCVRQMIILNIRKMSSIILNLSLVGSSYLPIRFDPEDSILNSSE